MTEFEVLNTCRDMRLLATFWAGAFGVALICCVWFGCRYYFDAGVRMPRLRRAARRLAQERDDQKAKAERLIVEIAQTKARMEQIGLEAQREINRVDAIRKKTEKALTASKDEADALRTFLASVNSYAPGSADSWVPPVDQAGIVEGSKVVEQATK